MNTHASSHALPTPWGTAGLSARLVGRAREAARVVARRLSELPPSADVEQLQGRVLEYMQEVERSPSLQPTAKQHEAMSLRILELFVQVTRIEALSESARYAGSTRL
jgi:uncharacterized protein YigA (DUF484 family)